MPHRSPDITAGEPDAGGAAVRVGIAVIVLRDGKVLLGRRVSVSHGAGTWQFPGGHLESFEEIEDCAVREVAEETGLVLGRLRRGPYTNDRFISEGRHYVTLYVVAEAPEGTPEVREPAKCAEWGWFDWDELPEPLFLPILNLRRQHFRPASE
jgi:8-oxo-dGTP diphosphatase